MLVMHVCLEYEIQVGIGTARILLYQKRLGRGRVYTLIDIGLGSLIMSDEHLL